MPGAVSGVVKSVDRNKGIIVTKYGNIEFTNTSDSLKINDLQKRYRIDDRVVLFINSNGADVDKRMAHMVCPQRELITGTAEVIAVRDNHAIGRLISGAGTDDVVFFASGRISHLLYARNGTKIAFRRVVRIGTPFRFRAMPDYASKQLKACDVDILPFQRSSYNNGDRHGDCFAKSDYRAEKRRLPSSNWSSDDDNNVTTPNHIQLHQSPNKNRQHSAIINSSPPPLHWSSTSSSPQFSLSPIRPPPLSTDDLFSTSSSATNLQPLLHTAIIASSNYNHQSTQTDAHPIKALAEKILSHPSLVNTLYKYRPQIFSIVIEAMNIDSLQ